MNKWPVAYLAAGVVCLAVDPAGAADLPQLVAAKLPSAVVERLNQDRALGGAPPVSRNRFGYEYSYEWKDPNEPFTSRTRVLYKPLAEIGLVLEHKHYTEGDGYTTNGMSYLAAGGLLTLLETLDVTDRNGTRKGREMRLAEYNISGDLYPVAKGNEFRIESRFIGWVDFELNHSCEVTRELDASEFSTNLAGLAFYVLCAVEVTGRETGAQDYYYIQELDHFIPDFRPETCRDCTGFTFDVQ